LQAKEEGKKLVYYCSSDARLRTNSAVLLGCYLILERGWTAEEVMSPRFVLSVCAQLNRR